MKTLKNVLMNEGRNLKMGLQWGFRGRGGTVFS